MVLNIWESGNLEIVKKVDGNESQPDLESWVSHCLCLRLFLWHRLLVGKKIVDLRRLTFDDKYLFDKYTWKIHTFWTIHLENCVKKVNGNECPPDLGWLTFNELGCASESNSTLMWKHEGFEHYSIFIVLEDTWEKYQKLSVSTKKSLIFPFGIFQHGAA